VITGLFRDRSDINKSVLTMGFVMAGLVPAIHVFPEDEARKTWMPGTRPGMTKAESSRRLVGRVPFRLEPLFPGYAGNP
jgi:hypothetical protein